MSYNPMNSNGCVTAKVALEIYIDELYRKLMSRQNENVQ